MNDVRMDLPCGFLKVHIEQAENLPNTDTSLSLSKKDLTDPFVTLKMGKVELLKTKTIKNDLNPKWDEKQLISVYQELEDITINVRDKESIGSVHVGSVGFAKEKFSEGTAIEGWFDLKNKDQERGRHSSKKSYGGKIKISVQFFPKTSDTITLHSLFKSDPVSMPMFADFPKHNTYLKNKANIIK